MKNYKIEKMISREGDVLLADMRERVLARCGVSGSAKVARPFIPRPRQWRALVAAACLLLVAVVALPAVIKLTEVPKEPVEYSYLENIPEKTSTLEGFASYLIRLMPASEVDKSVEVDDSQLMEFFNSQTPGENITMDWGRVLYDSKGKVREVSLDFVSSANKSICVHIADGDYIDNKFRNSDLVTKVGDYEVTKWSRYRFAGRNSETGERILDDKFLDTFIYLRKEGLSMIIAATGIKEDGKIALTESVYNFLLNAEFDFKALK